MRSPLSDPPNRSLSRKDATDAHHRELRAAVGQAHARVGTAQHLDDPLPGAHRHQHGLVRTVELVVQLGDTGHRVAPRSPM